MRYLRLFGLSVLINFAATWIWVIAMPMAFLDREYAAWRAKQALLDRCDLGAAIVLGDSRAAADIIPARLPLRVANLAIGGGEAVEALSVLHRALACPDPPRLVILSFDPGHFIRPDLFWERSVRFGTVLEPDIAGLRDASQATGDGSVYRSHPLDGIPARVRDWLYRVHFPPLYFSSLMHGGLFLRWMQNRRVLEDTLSARGHTYFGTDAGASVVALEGHMDAFRPLPILDRYFDRILALLDRRGIEARFVAMPVNEATWREVRPEVQRAFADYLLHYERRYTHFRLASEVMPHWPDRFFGDQFCHLNPEGAALFSDQLAQRLQAPLPNMQNEAREGWLRETGSDASATVAPLAKRGS